MKRLATLLAGLLLATVVMATPLQQSDTGAWGISDRPNQGLTLEVEPVTFSLVYLLDARDNQSWFLIVGKSELEPNALAVYKPGVVGVGDEIGYARFDSISNDEIALELVIIDNAIQRGLCKKDCTEVFTLSRITQPILRTPEPDT